jgi:hypothetical protein
MSNKEGQMALKNYTTTIDVHKTLGEIQGILVKHGARKIMYDYDDNGHILALCFSIQTPDGDRGIRLPADAKKVWEVLRQQKKAGKIKTNPDYEQAERTAWRIIKDWVDAQMAILEYKMVQFEEIFLPYMLNAKGQTFFQAYQQRQLMSGD